MGFADWKKSSKKFRHATVCTRYCPKSMEELCQAAYKAGEREGRKQVEEIAQNAADLAIAIERGTKAWADVPDASAWGRHIACFVLTPNAVLRGEPLAASPIENTVMGDNHGKD